MLPRNRVSTHPGEMLLEEFLKPLGMTQAELADRINVEPTIINEICDQNRAVSVDIARLLANEFQTSPDLWLGLQADHDATVSRVLP